MVFAHCVAFSGVPAFELPAPAAVVPLAEPSEDLPELTAGSREHQRRDEHHRRAGTLLEAHAFLLKRDLSYLAEVSPTRSPRGT
jgi:hypothetical protein